MLLFVFSEGVVEGLGEARHASSSVAGFLSKPCPIDILGDIICCCGDCPCALQDI